MATTSTAPLYIDALVAALKLRSFIVTNKVGVFSAPEMPVPDEAIVFVDCTDNVDWGAIGKTRQDEGYTWAGVIRVSKTGGGDDIGKAARDRAYAILNEVKDACRTDPPMGLVANGVMQSRVSREILRQRLDDQSRIAYIEFDVAVRARIGG